MKIDKNAAEMKADSDRLDAIKNQIKEHAITQLRDGDKKVTIPGKHYVFALSRSESVSVNKDALKSDGLLDKYSKKTTTYKLTTTVIKEDK